LGIFKIDTAASSKSCELILLFETVQIPLPNYGRRKKRKGIRQRGFNRYIHAYGHTCLVYVIVFTVNENPYSAVALHANLK
jgi:hypothetical protein